MRGSTLPAFARADSDAPGGLRPRTWPTPVRLGSSVRAGSAPMRRPGWRASRRRAVADPAWFWGAAADDLGLAWQRRPSSTLDLAGGPSRARWWRGGAFNFAAAAPDPLAAARPDDAALAWEGEDGDVRRFTRAELTGRSGRAPAMPRPAWGAGRRVGIFLPMLLETASRSSRSASCRRSSRRSSPATRPRPWPRACGVRGDASDHRRRLPPPRRASP